MRLALIALLLPLAACGPVNVAAPPMDQPPVMGEPLATCRSTALPSFTGQPATQELGARMLAASGARVLRWVADGMMVTMDFREDRLTVQLDRNNRVERASCG